jgi:hypothetical protein
MPASVDERARQRLSGFARCVVELGAHPDSRCLEQHLDDQGLERFEALLRREAEVSRDRNIDADDYGFRLLGYDGRVASYEMQLRSRPTATLYLERREETWTVSFVDP